MVNAKQVVDMTEYIDKFGTNIKELLGDTAKAANINNYIYGVTTGREWFCQSSAVMRKDIIDECGIDVSAIHSYKDLTDVFAVVKEKYPDMNMMASNNGTTPDVKYEMVDTLTDGFGVLMNQGQDTTVTNYYETEEYKKFGFTYDSTSVTNELAALSNVKAQYAPALGTGSVNPEETLPKFIEELKKAGIDKVIETKQEQLDKWLSEQ